MLTNSFLNDLLYLRDKLINKQPFCITRFGDGEMMIMKGIHLNLLNKGEFNFRGEEDIRKDLCDSFTHNQKDYIVGVACRCCIGDAKHEDMKKATGLPDEKMTIANIFVNSNYPHFRNKVVPAFKEYKITLVSPGDPKKLPFEVQRHIPIGPDAWTKNADIYTKLDQQLSTSNTHELILLCAGPFANILCKKLFEKYPKHTIMDLGSVFNIELGIGADRGYLKGGPSLFKTCIW